MGITYLIKRPHTFDSVLTMPDNENATSLILTLRICLEQLNPRGGRPEGTTRDWDTTPRTRHIRRWTTAEWSQYKNALVKSVHQLWNNKLFLLFPDQRGANRLSSVDLAALNHPSQAIRGYAPFIKCLLSIQLQELRHGSHAVVRAVRLAENETRPFRSAVDDHGSGLVTDQDAALAFDPEAAADEPVFHQTIPHEVGHLLGLEHSNEHDRRCHDDLPICYRGTPPKRANVMGEGMEVTSANAWPWLHRIRLHTHHAHGWRAVTHSPVDVNCLLGHMGAGRRP